SCAATRCPRERGSLRLRESELTRMPMFTRRRKIIARGDTTYLFAPAKEGAEDFLSMTTGSRHFHEPWVYPATDAKRFKAYLDRLERGNAFGFFVARTDDDSLVGVININDVVLGGFRSGSLGYYAEHDVVD